MLESFVAVLAPLKEWLPILRTAGRERLQEEAEALTALYTALNETRFYLAARDPTRFTFGRAVKPKDRDPQAEEKLSRLWIPASVQLRSVNHDLANRCFIKAGLLGNGADWGGVEGADCHSVDADNSFCVSRTDRR